MIDITDNILFIGGDIRHYNTFKAVGKEFRKTFICGYENFLPNFDKITTAKVIVLPTVPTFDGKNIFAPNFKDEIKIEDIIKNAKKCELIICGIKKLEKCDIPIFAYTNISEFKAKNAIPTAEGAISLAVSNTDFTLHGSRVLIIGAGSIAKALIVRLLPFGCEISVSARKEFDFAYIKSMHCECLHSKIIDNTEKYDIIFNTVPFRLLNDFAIQKIKNDCLYIELASRPYGIDFDKKYHFNSLLASSLPSKFAPKSASEIIAETIIKILKGEINAEN